MSNEKKRSLSRRRQDRLRQLTPALNGLSVLLVERSAVRILAGLSLAAVALAVLAGMEAGEWSLLLIALSMLWLVHTLSAALETAVDAATAQTSPQRKTVRELASAAKWLAGLAAALMLLGIFWP